MKKLIALVLAVMLVVPALLACGSDSKDETVVPTTKAALTEMGKTTPTPTKTVSPTPAKTADALTPSPTKTAAATKDNFVSLDSLKSYKMRMVSNMLDPMGSGEMMDITTDMEVINTPTPAKRMTIGYPTGAGDSVEMIIIGDSSWMKLGETWMKSPVSPSVVQQPMDVTDFLSDVNNKMDLQGTETVNDVKCKRYKVESSVTTTNPNPQGGTATVTARFTGQIWIADQSGLPEMMIREKGTTEVQGLGGMTTVTMTVDITDINGSFTIEPPPADQVTDMGGLEDLIPKDLLPQP